MITARYVAKQIDFEDMTAICEEYFLEGSRFVLASPEMLLHLNGDEMIVTNTQNPWGGYGKWNWQYMEWECIGEIEYLNHKMMIATIKYLCK